MRTRSSCLLGTTLVVLATCIVVGQDGADTPKRQAVGQLEAAKRAALVGDYTFEIFEGEKAYGSATLTVKAKRGSKELSLNWSRTLRAVEQQMIVESSGAAVLGPQLEVISLEERDTPKVPGKEGHQTYVRTYELDQGKLTFVSSSQPDVAPSERISVPVKEPTYHGVWCLVTVARVMVDHEPGTYALAQVDWPNARVERLPVHVKRLKDYSGGGRKFAEAVEVKLALNKSLGTDLVVVLEPKGRVIEFSVGGLRFLPKRSQ